MFGDIIVPVDGSEESARALHPASALARYLDTTMHVVSYHGPGVDGVELAQKIQKQLSAVGAIRRTSTVSYSEQSVANNISTLLMEMPSALVVMATHGRGRSAAVIGSVANDVLNKSVGPVLLIGPEMKASRFRLHGPMLVPTDGSNHAAAVLPIVEAFAIVFDFDPEVVTVLDGDNAAAYANAAQQPGADLPPESGAVHGAAAVVERVIDRPVGYEVLHASDPAKAVVQRAVDTNAALIAMATHAERGLGRIGHGSVTASVVAKAPCPVLAYRPRS